MSGVTIVPIVEGQGEERAVPVLLRRMAIEIAPEIWPDVRKPLRGSRQALIAPNGIERYAERAAVLGGPGASLLVLLDADDDCPRDLGPRLLSRIRGARSDRHCSVVLANREFEAWFLASALSLGGHRGLAEDLASPAYAETPRDCKGWLTAHRTDGRSYKPAADQAALTAVFDMALARSHSPSFDKLWRDVTRLLTGKEG
jgi:Domain of unknown function (DUF4276)